MIPKTPPAKAAIGTGFRERSCARAGTASACYARAAARPAETCAMPRKLVSSGSSFESDIGYSRAVADGDFIFVSGTTGFDYATMTIAGDVVAQCRQSMRNIASALAQADASIADV